MKLIIILLISCLFSLPERYHTFYEIEEQLLEWNEEFGNNQSPWPAQYPGSGIIYSLHQIGVSQSDNLPIYAVKLSYNADIDEDEPRVLILGQCHAEEIYGVEIAMELIDWLLHPNTSYPVGYLDRKLGIENTELWIIPTHNPEGLLTVHGDVIGSEWVQDEWYRKNKSDINSNNVFDYVYGPGNDSDGVDLNRNYDFNWIFGDDEYELDYGCSSNPSYISNYDYYRGKYPFSESEIQAIRDFAIEKQFLLSIAYHSSRSGCVSEKVIYPWKWTEDKPSPDFEVADKLGRDIAAFIPTQDGISTYLPSGSISRRGNAHDWFYSQTGCIQYLIEAGTSNIQSSDEEIIEDTIDRNLIGAFHLINRASGNNVGQLGADKYMINGIVTDSISGETLNAEVKILEMDGSMLKPRLTDSFGRYRRLLYPGTFTLEISAEGYETYIESGIVPSASSFVERDVALTPLDEFTVEFNFNYPDDYSADEPLKLTYTDKWNKNELIITDSSTLNLYEGIYDIEITSIDNNYILPIKGQLNVNSNLILNYDLNWSTVLYSGISGTDWVFNGDWLIDDEINSQSSSFYSNDNYQSLILDSLLWSNGTLVSMLNLKYELEWDNDLFNVAFVASDGGAFYDSVSRTGHSYNEYSQLIHSINNPGNFNFELNLETDVSLNYRGVKIKDLLILTNSPNECDRGDLNHDGLKNINDIIIMIDVALNYIDFDGFIKCVSDMNNDDIINIQDVIMLVFSILGDLDEN